MSDYQHQTIRCVNAGLDLRDSADKVEEGSWIKLNNVRSTQEGQIQSREAFTAFQASLPSLTPIHSIRRLDASTLVIGAGTGVSLNAGELNPIVPGLASMQFSGNPLSLVAYRGDQSSTAWMYIADSLVMRKLRAPLERYKWGITGPVNPASYATAGAGNLNSSVAGATVYDWRYTYRSSVTGAESNPSPVQSGISAVNEQVSISVVASTDSQVDEIVVYRRGGTLGVGSSESFWTLSFTAPNTSGNVIDNNADSTIAANEILSLDRDVPFTSIDSAGNTALEVPMPYVWGPFQGKYLLACGAPNQPGYVFWTNPGSPDEAASSNNVEVTPPQEPLQNGCIFASLPFVASKDDWYTLDFGQSGGATFQPRKLMVGKGLSTPWAFCVGPESVFFLGDDGIYETNFNGAARSITEEHLRPLFRGLTLTGGTGLSTPDVGPVDYSQPTQIRMEYFAGEVWFRYNLVGGTSKALVYSTSYKRWRSLNALSSSTTSFCNMMYADENQAAARLLLANSSALRVLDYTAYTDSGPTPIPFVAQTGYHDQGTPQSLKEYGNLIVDCLGSYTVNIKTNASASTVHTFALVGDGSRQKHTRSLQDLRAYNISVEFVGASNVGGGNSLYQFDILYRQEEEPLRHWQFITTHGMTGWQHVRDAYIVLISTAVVTFTVNVDGTDFVYQIPSTGGLRKKNYVQLQPTKGKIFTYSLDCASDFRLFGNECEIRAKSWNTALGYQLISPFQDQQVEA